MPILIDIDGRLAVRRMTLTELAARVGITLPNLSVLKNGHAKAVRFSTLEAICRELDCQPGDIIRYEPDSTERAGTPAAPAAAIQGSP